MSFIDDCIAVGKKAGVLKTKEKLKEHFDCDDVGELNEYIGWKIDYKPEERTLKLTQPALLQSFKDEFDLPEGPTPNTPAMSGTVMQKGDPELTLDGEQTFKYQSGVGKLLHLIKW